MASIEAEFKKLAAEKGVKVADNEIDDALIYALFPEIGLKFLENRNNPDAFEPVPSADDMKVANTAAKAKNAPESYSVSVDGQLFNVQVGPEGSIDGISPVKANAAQVNTTVAANAAAPAPTTDAEGEDVPAPLAGNIFKVLVNKGDHVDEGDVLVIMEAMKMETEIRAPKSGTVQAVNIREGDAVNVGDSLFVIG